MATFLKIYRRGSSIFTLMFSTLPLPALSANWFIALPIFDREDMYSPESIDLLRNHGIDLQRHEEIGINPNDFAELMITSGLVLTDETKWISFHRYACWRKYIPVYILPTLGQLPSSPCSGF
jgi:hypothetical protein